MLDVREHTVRDNTSKFRVMLPHHVNKYLMMDICTRKRRIARQRQNVFTLFTFHTSFVSFQSVYCLLVCFPISLPVDVEVFNVFDWVLHSTSITETSLSICCQRRIQLIPNRSIKYKRKIRRI